MEIAPAWRRIVAGLIDFVIVVLMSLSIGWVVTTSSLAGMLLVLPLLLVNWAYSFLLHAWFGCTFGKELLGLRVVTVGGEPVGWSRAFRRSAVDLVFHSLVAAAEAPVVWELPESAFVSQGWTEMFHAIEGDFPSWSGAIDTLWFSWALSEFVTMFLNRQRRALHDFLGGTIVIRDRERVDPAVER